MSTFALRSGDRVLSVDLGGSALRALAGSMVAFEGDVSFSGQRMGGGEGLRGAIKRRVAGEGVALMECSGRGTVHLARDADEITLLELSGDTLAVESSSLLALEAGLRTDVVFTGLRGASSGQGLFTTTVTGAGTVAVLTDGPAVALAVTPDEPLVVDPDAYVASRGRLQQDFVTDVSWRSVVGQGSGEAFSLRFTGTGTVYLQPSERR